MRTTSFRCKPAAAIVTAHTIKVFAEVDDELGCELSHAMSAGLNHTF